MYLSRATLIGSLPMIKTRKNLDGDRFILLSQDEMKAYATHPEIVNYFTNQVKEGNMETYNILFIGDYFSLTTSVFTDTTDDEDYLIKCADDIVKSHHGFSPLQASYAVSVYDEQGNEISEDN
jgi:hypothetical protein